MRRIALTLLLLIISGAGVFGLTIWDRSAVPTWIPPSVVEVVPDRQVLRSLVPTSWAAIKSHLRMADSAASAPVLTAEIKDYEFQLVDPEMKQGDAVVAVRLVHKPSGRSVPDAVIYARRIDMAPEGMPTMTAPLEVLPEAEPGIYRFKTNLMMEGGWQLSLAAKVQGETGTLRHRLVLKAVQ